jgi:hypothetical protein
MKKSTGIATLAAIAALAVPATTSGAASHVTRFKAGESNCGVQLPSQGGMSCFSPVLPGTVLDGYVELHAHGKPRLGERGDSPWRGGKSTRLHPGDRWSRVGVRCVKRSALRCHNADGHGFVIGGRDYRLF